MNSKIPLNKVLDSQELRTTDFENFFDIYIDARGNYSFNLNSTMYFQFDPKGLPEFICDTPMFWPLMSYKLYGSTRFAWMLMKLNNVTASNMFRRLEPGEKIKYLPQETMQNIVQHLNR